MSAEKIARAAQKIVDWQIDCNHLLKVSDGSTAPVVPFNVAKRIIAEELADSILITREQLEGIEWRGPYKYGTATCPVCRLGKLMDVSKRRHFEDCWIGRALGEKRG